MTKTVPEGEAHYCADRNVPGPSCGFRIFIQDKREWNWTREAGYASTEASAIDWAKQRGLKPVYLG